MMPTIMKRYLTSKRTWLNLSWFLLFLILPAFIPQGYWRGHLCNQMGVDFRGYYASAQIAWHYGFSEVYNQEMQKDLQSTLIYSCPVPADQPPLFVGMPYLPVYVLLFLPFILFDFTHSYIIWTVLQLGIFLVYLWRFAKAFGERPTLFRILQLGVCIPLIANLYVGQINALLVMLLGEFVIAFSRGKKETSGVWLSTLLMKPHTLILLIPGLLVSQNWTVLVGFVLGSVVILSASLFLIGFQGIASMIQLTYQFAGPLIQNPSGMMNLRALALNLAGVIPSWIGWMIAGVGTSVILILVLHRWLHWRYRLPTQQVLIITASAFGTFMISWHSHFYMLMLVVPLLIYLDTRNVLTPYQLGIWLLGPPLIYVFAHLVNPALERNIFGMGMLVLNIFMFLSTLKQSWESSDIRDSIRPPGGG